MDKARPVLKVVSHPAFGLTGWCFGLIAVFAATHFYRATIQRPELAYSVRPLRTVVVRGIHRDFHIFYDGKRIETPVTGIEVVVWNRGSEIIRTANILEPVCLRTAQHTPILDVHVDAVRPAMEFGVQTMKAAAGEVTLTWKSMAPGDVALIRLIYAGDPDVEVSMDGMIEGQGQVRRFDPPEGRIYRRDFDPAQRLLAQVSVAAVIVLGLAGILLMRGAEGFLPARFQWIETLAFLALLGFICYGVWGTFETPPVGF